MKTIKKFTTFEDLKSSEGIIMDEKAAIKKHNEFEKIFKAIYSKVHKTTIHNPR